MKKLLKYTAVILSAGLLLSGIDYFGSYIQASEGNKSYITNDSSYVKVNNPTSKHKNIEKELNEISEEE